MSASDTASLKPDDDGSVASDEGLGLGPLLADKYQLQRIIASGGMGVVFLASHVHLGTDVAVKVLHDSAVPAARKRFLREAKLAAKLDAPNLVRVLDYGFSGEGAPYLVMEYLQGRTLRGRLRDGRMPTAEALRLARELVTALTTIHRAGVVHRDLKPTNVFLCRGDDDLEHVKIIDFGIAKHLGDDGSDGPNLTGTGDILGTLRYMAPEQIRRSHEVDHRADIWSVGTVMYEMFAGRAPFAGASDLETLAARFDQDRRAPPVLDPDFASWLRYTVARCLQYEPEHRFDSAATLLACLTEERTDSVPLASDVAAPPASRAAVATDDATLGSVTSHWSRTERSTSRQRALVVLGTVAVVAIAAIGVVTSSTEAPGEPLTGQLAGVAGRVAPEVDLADEPLAAPPAAGSAEAAAQATQQPTGAQPPARSRPASPSKATAQPRFDDRH